MSYLRFRDHGTVFDADTINTFDVTHSLSRSCHHRKKERKRELQREGERGGGGRGGGGGCYNSDERNYRIERDGNVKHSETPQFVQETNDHCIPYFRDPVSLSRARAREREKERKRERESEIANGDGESSDDSDLGVIDEFSGDQSSRKSHASSLVGKIKKCVERSIRERKERKERKEKRKEGEQRRERS